MKYPSGKTVTKADREGAKERLSEWLQNGDTLWFILRHRSASGMQRVYDVKQFERPTAVSEDNPNVLRLSVSTLSWNIAMACNLGWNELRGGIRINGCGFSGEQEITDTVSQILGIKLRYETL